MNECINNDYKHDFIERFMESCFIISTIKDSDIIAKSIVFLKEDMKKLYFDNSAIKNNFLAKMKTYSSSIKIINCDSSLRRLENEINNIEEYELVVFDNINKCDPIFLEKIKNIGGIYIY